MQIQPKAVHAAVRVPADRLQTPFSNRRRRLAASRGKGRGLERQLVTALHGYQRDTPEDAFPSFLEALHCDELK